MSRVRTFIALDPGKAIRDRLIALQEDFAKTLPDVKWVEPDNLHVTLLFLGEVDNRTLPDLCRAVQDAVAEQPAFPMSIEGTGCFPNPRRPRVLWVGVGLGAQEVCAVHDAAEAALLDLGCYRREERKYTPHVTLGRIKGDVLTGPVAPALTKFQAWKGGEVLVREVHVMSSQLTPRGPIYTVLGRAKLA
jgi:RNA 2',3'-cyclic 3'-phosphodiesterase